MFEVIGVAAILVAIGNQLHHQKLRRVGMTLVGGARRGLKCPETLGKAVNRAEAWLEGLAAILARRMASRGATLCLHTAITVHGHP